MEDWQVQLPATPGFDSDAVEHRVDDVVSESIDGTAAVSQQQPDVFRLPVVPALCRWGRVGERSSGRVSLLSVAATFWRAEKGLTGSLSQARSSSSSTSRCVRLQGSFPAAHPSRVTRPAHHAWNNPTLATTLRPSTPSTPTITDPMTTKTSRGSTDLSRSRRKVPEPAGIM